MSTADWEEVKRLAADFQRAQLTSASQRLTEKNCIEIVNKLLELKLIDVVFTSDGKEYVTPQQVLKEIQDEVYLHGGRLSLVELSQSLNVSHQAIEKGVQELVRTERGTYFSVLGQILTAGYLDNLCEELDEKLSQEGIVSLSELSKMVDLPGEFLQAQVERRMGKIISNGVFDESDPTLIYTDAYVRRITCRLRGVLSAITKPTPLGHIVTDRSGSIPPKLIYSIINKLISSKRIDGILSGGSSNRSLAGYFNPSSFNRAQNEWVDGFMRGNGYIDLDAAGRLLGVADPRSFVLKRFPEQKLVFLKSYCLGESLFNQVKESIEESLVSPGWVDINTLLPMSVSEKDIKLLLIEQLESFLEKEGAKVFGGSLIMSMKLIRTLKSTLFTPMMEEKSKQDIESGRYVQLLNEIRNAEKRALQAELSKATDSRSNKKDERRKRAAGGKTGGGAQGRETKTKSTKKKYLAGKRDKQQQGGSSSESEEEKVTLTTNKAKKAAGGPPSTLEFLSTAEICQHLKKCAAAASQAQDECLSSLTEAPEELITGLAAFMSNPLQDEYQRVLKEKHDQFLKEQYERSLAEQKKKGKGGEDELDASKANEDPTKEEPAKEKVKIPEGGDAES